VIGGYHIWWNRTGCATHTQHASVQSSIRATTACCRNPESKSFTYKVNCPRRAYCTVQCARDRAPRRGPPAGGIPSSEDMMVAEMRHVAQPASDPALKGRLARGTNSFSFAYSSCSKGNGDGALAQVGILLLQRAASPPRCVDSCRCPAAAPRPGVTPFVIRGKSCCGSRRCGCWMTSPLQGHTAT
jgi:hypothetical protein